MDLSIKNTALQSKLDEATKIKAADDKAKE